MWGGAPRGRLLSGASPVEDAHPHRHLRDTVEVVKALIPVLLALHLIAPLAVAPPPCCVEVEVAAADACCDSPQPACPATPSGECALSAGKMQAAAVPSILQAPESPLVLGWTIVPATLESASPEPSIIAQTRARAAPDRSRSVRLQI